MSLMIQISQLPSALIFFLFFWSKIYLQKELCENTQEVLNAKFHFLMEAI